MWRLPLHWLRLHHLEAALSWMCSGSAQLCTLSYETLTPFVASQTRNLFAQPSECQSWQTTAKDSAERAGVIIMHLNKSLHSFITRLYDQISAPEFSLYLSSGNLTFFAQLSVMFHSHVLAVRGPWLFETSYSFLLGRLMAAWRKRLRAPCMLPFVKLTK